MKKPVIGILPTSNYMQNDDPFQDTYRFCNNYIKAIIASDGIPLLIPYEDNKIIIDSLEMCDGLLLPGGNKVLPANKDVISYFYENNKPILGICLGMQTIGMWSVPDRRIINTLDNDRHKPFEITRDDKEKLVHFNKVEKDSILFDIFQNDRIEVNSLHGCYIDSVGDNFKISMTSEDGIIEGIECVEPGKFIVGVQFHPEILPQYKCLFDRFIKECSKEK